MIPAQPANPPHLMTFGASRDDVDSLDDDFSDLIRTTVAIHRTLRVREALLAPTVDAVVEAAKMFTGFDAGLILVENGQLVPQATTARAPYELDMLQLELGFGPCLEAATGQTVVEVTDTARESRWDQFGRRASILGVRSMLCVPLWIEERLVGTMSLYASEASAFSERDRGTAVLCATLAAAALADAMRTEQLRTAIARRDVIGQAKGVLMATLKITADDAFALLRRASQERNEKLILVAEHVVETGLVPASSRPDRPLPASD